MSRQHAASQRLCSYALLALFASFPDESAAWVATSTRAIVPRDAVLLGPVAAGAPIRVAVSLKLRNADQLSAFLAHIRTPGDPLYGARLGGAQFADAYSPTAAQAQSVMQYLAGKGFRNLSVAPNRLLVTADATALAVQNAFHTVLMQYRLGERTAFANSTDAEVPDALGDTVLAVLGLQNLESHRSFGAQPAPLKTLLGYSPQNFQQAYHAGSTPAAAGVVIAIFTAGSMTPVIADLRAYETAFGLPWVPVAVIKAGAGSTGTADTEEWDLDTQVSTGLAGNVAQLRLYAADSLLDVDLIPAFNRFVTDNLASAGSVSFGICEIFAAHTGATATEDLVFKQAVAQGQTVFAASGDAGSACAVPIALPVNANGIPLAGVPAMQAMPAASPYVVAVGGTTLAVDSGYNRAQEVAWDAGGGGISLFESAPGWQSLIVGGAPPGRGVPDIAIDADPNTGAIIYFKGAQVAGVGGTSLSAPLALGAWARIQQAHGGALGFAAPIFYGLHPVGANPPIPGVAVTGFHDVLAGCNGLYCAGPQWDFVTGLGSPDIEILNGLIP